MCPPLVFGAQKKPDLDRVNGRDDAVFCPLSVEQESECYCLFPC